MEFAIDNTSVYGLDRAVKASGNPMRTEIDTSIVSDRDLKRAVTLGNTKGGEGHDNFLKGILVQMDITAPTYWWKEAQRYHWFDFISSQSTMHCLLQFNLDKQCTADVDPRIISVVQERIDEYKEMSPTITPEQKEYLWRGIVASLPSGFCLSATMTTNYQQLKTMFFQRRNHKLKEWHTFCDWCLSLPYFKDFILHDDIV